MAERRLVDNQDKRSQVTATVTWYPSRWSTEPSSRMYRSSRVQGPIKSVSGVQGGKYTPGDLKLRSFAASTSTYSYGAASLERLQDHVVDGVHTGHRVTFEGPFGAWSPMASELGKNGVPRSTEVGWNSSLAFVCQNRAMAKFNDSDYDVGAFVGELPETFEMLRQWTLGYRKAIKNARKGGFTWSRLVRAWNALKSGKPLKKLPDKLSNSWLTWRYGIRPLYWDALMLIEIANESIKRIPDGGLRRVSAQQTVADGGYAKPSSDYSLRSMGSYKAVLTWSMKTKCKTVVYYRTTANRSNVDWILQKYGLNPRQFPGLVWELTPLSFVVDWFADVGSWLAAIVPRPDVRVLGYATSQVCELRVIRQGNESVPLSGYGPLTGTFPRDEVSIREFRRNVGDSVPGLVPWFNPGIFLNLQKKADLLSLALQKCRPKH